jgi:hypothetical protein
MATATLEDMHDLIQSIPGVCLREKMDMVRLNCQRDHDPAVLFSYLFDDLPAPVDYRIFEHTPLALRA